MEPLANLVECIHLLIIFAKHSILGVSQSRCAFVKFKKNLVRCYLFKKKSGLQSLQISSTFTLRWDIINRKLNTHVFHFKLIPPGSWILTYYIKQAQFICSNYHNNFSLILSKFFGKCEESNVNYTVLF